VNGARVISFAALCREPDRARRISVAVAEPRVRAALVARLAAEGFAFCEIRAADCRIFERNVIGDGAIFCSNTVVTVNATIGRHFHCNIYAYVEHDCVIGDFVTFAPRVSCNGRVVIEDFAYIGAGAIFKQGSHDKPLTVGAGAVVGMGAVVTRDVPPGVTVVGNPARAVAVRR
jgi:sugar O-acyltransferase (sialic acid O-acetyltransferase NeuD family)